MDQLKLSDDGLYYWDGRQWVTTLSHDGRTRWNGTAWVPVTAAGAVPPGYPSYYAQRPAMVRVPTSWTRPLQYAVVAYYALSAAWAMSIPFVLSPSLKQAVDQAVQQSFQRNQQIDPNFPPPSAQSISGMESLVTDVLWVTAVFVIALAVIAIIGALRRWVWVYWAVLVLLGLGVLGLLLTLGSTIAGPSSLTANVGTPAWISWLSVFFGLLDAGLFVWMLVALIRRGPWAMPKVAAAPISGAASPAG